MLDGCRGLRGHVVGGGVLFSSMGFRCNAEIVEFAQARNVFHIYGSIQDLYFVLSSKVIGS